MVISNKRIYKEIFKKEDPEEIMMRKISFLKTRKDNPGKKAYYFIPSNYLIDIYEKMYEVFPTHLDLTEHIEQLDGPGCIKFIQRYIDYTSKPKEVDLSKALIFVVGNLDEVYTMNKDINPDISADLFHRHSLKITMPQVKAALQERFRSEQIARLGNNHLIYPALNANAYKQIISSELSKIQNGLLDKFDIEIAFDQSINKMIYDEGVFPRQGTRPVFSTIRNLIDGYTGKILYALIGLKENIHKINWKFIREKHLIDYLDKYGKVRHTKEFKVKLKIIELRKSKKDDKQALVAVHESGHAIVAALATRIIPQQIVSRTASHNSEGFCRMNLPEEIQTFKYIRHDIMIGLAGYLAEELIFGKEHISVGAQEDIALATNLAIKCIKRCGMNNEPIAIQVPHHSTNDYFFEHKKAEAKALELIKESKMKAFNILNRNKLLLLKMAEWLSVHSQMKKQMIKQFLIKYAAEGWVKKEGFIKKEAYYDFKRQIYLQLQEAKNNKQVSMEKYLLNGTTKVLA